MHESRTTTCHNIFARPLTAISCSEKYQVPSKTSAGICLITATECGPLIDHCKMMDTSDLHSHKDGKASKVRFPADQDDTCNEIHAIRIPETNEIEVHAGFFKTNHR